MDALHGRAVATRPRRSGEQGRGRGGSRRWSGTGVPPATMPAHPPVCHKVFHRGGRPAAKAPESGSRFFFFFRAIACVRKHCPTDGLSAADLTTAGRPTEGSTPPPSPVSRTRRAVPPSPVGGALPGAALCLFTHGGVRVPGQVGHVDAPYCPPILPGPQAISDKRLAERKRRHLPAKKDGAPNGTRTRVPALKGRCPRPLDDGDVSARLPSIAASSRPAVAGRATSPGRWTGRRPRRRRARQAARRPS